jgi:hypothetical protein
MIVWELRHRVPALFRTNMLCCNLLLLLQAGDGHSDQMVLLSGPPGDPFLDVHNFNGAQVRRGAAAAAAYVDSHCIYCMLLDVS